MVDELNNDMVDVREGIRACCETGRILFGSVSPQILISTTARLLKKTNGLKNTANSEPGGTGFWLISEIFYFVAQIIWLLFASDFNNL